MKNKFTTIKLKPDISTFVFGHSEQTEQTTETTIGFAETCCPIKQLSTFYREKNCWRGRIWIDNRQFEKKNPKSTQFRKK